MGHFDPPGLPESTQSPKGEGGSLYGETKPLYSFPKVPVRQTLVRRLVRNLHKSDSSRERGDRKLLRPPRVECSCDLRKVLPHTILLMTNKNIGTHLCDGFRLLFNNRSLAGHPRWIRELFYSPSSIPQSCLGVLHNLLWKKQISRQVVKSTRVGGPKEFCLRAL